MILKMLKGKYLDRMGSLYGLKRKRRFLILKESDEDFRKRIIQAIQSKKSEVEDEN